MIEVGTEDWQYPSSLTNQYLCGCPLRADVVNFLRSLLGGSWLVISGVICRVTIVITIIRGLITPVITTHEPPSISRGERSLSGVARVLQSCEICVARRVGTAV